METLEVLSLGAGVQSSVMLLRACVGETKKPDVAVFADTQWEPRSVYEYLEFLKTESGKAGIPVHVVSRGDIKKAFLGEAEIKANPPLFVDNDGKAGMLTRQCTQDYKIVPIRRHIRTLQTSRKQPVNMWLGITVDEIMRAKPSRVKWVTHVFPLLKERWRRSDCVTWIQRNGFPEPPKSACIGCPFRNHSQWLAIKNSDEWDSACEVDEAMRSEGRWQSLKGPAYLTRSLLPLRIAKFSNEVDGQIDMFNNECEGMCGL